MRIRLQAGMRPAALPPGTVTLIDDDYLEIECTIEQAYAWVEQFEEGARPFMRKLIEGLERLEKEKLDGSA